jgi:hypothetical protein
MEADMCVFGEEITLENPADVGMARRGFIKESEVRRLTVKALVDTCAWTLVINEATRAKLGLRILGPSTSEAADGVEVAGFTTEPVNIYWQDRYTGCNAFVLPNETEVLLGALPLETRNEARRAKYPAGHGLAGGPQTGAPHRRPRRQAPAVSEVGLRQAQQPGGLRREAAFFYAKRLTQRRRGGRTNEQ